MSHILKATGCAAIAVIILLILDPLFLKLLGARVETLNGAALVITLIVYVYYTYFTYQILSANRELSKTNNNLLAENQKLVRTNVDIAEINKGLLDEAKRANQASIRPFLALNKITGQLVIENKGSGAATNIFVFKGTCNDGGIYTNKEIGSLAVGDSVGDYDDALKFDGPFDKVYLEACLRGFFKVDPRTLKEAELNGALKDLWLEAEKVAKLGDWQAVVYQDLSGGYITTIFDKNNYTYFRPY